MKILLYFIGAVGLFFGFILLQGFEDGDDISCQLKHSDIQLIYSNISITLSPSRLRKLAEADEIIYAVVKEHRNNVEDGCYLQAMNRFVPAQFQLSICAL